MGSSEKVTSAPLRLYAYGIGQQHLQASISTLNLPIILTRSLEDADAILTLKSQLRKHTSLSRMAETYQLPIYTIRANSLPQINTTLRQILGLEPDDLGLDESDLGHLTRRSAGDDIDALEEARIAIEQIVLPKKQPVDLLPRNSYVRKMQHELVEHYHLTSESLGQEPNRRLRIYPA